jgi:UAA transporter family
VTRHTQEHVRVDVVNFGHAAGISSCPAGCLPHRWPNGSLPWDLFLVDAAGTQYFSSHRSCADLSPSTALTLERVTSEYPKSGSLITFCQFLFISLHGLPKFITFTRGPLGIPIPRLLPRRIPFIRYLTQVGLFYFVSLLNNLAFGYSIPMPVHIIFRSGGLVVSMLTGWLISGKS